MTDKDPALPFNPQGGRPKNGDYSGMPRWQDADPAQRTRASKRSGELRAAKKRLEERPITLPKAPWEK